MNSNWKLFVPFFRAKRSRFFLNLSSTDCRSNGAVLERILIYEFSDTKMHKWQPKTGTKWLDS